MICRWGGGSLANLTRHLQVASHDQSQMREHYISSIDHREIQPSPQSAQACYNQRRCVPWRVDGALEQMQRRDYPFAIDEDRPRVAPYPTLSAHETMH